MSKHEIRLRRQKITGRGTERFRNYGAVLQRHEEEKRIKKIFKVVTYFLLILIITVLIVIFARVENRAKKGITLCTRVDVFTYARRFV